jgi:soluble lytic murein transglycosylase-like protein
MPTSFKNKHMKTLLTIFSAVLAYIVITALYVEPEPKKCIPSERMFESIIQYADTFDIPLWLAFNVAALESDYRGPLDSAYKHNVVSRAGAVGPMQIMPQYATWFAGFDVGRQELKDSIELNVWLSMKILRYLYDKYHDWTKVLGAYNTGKPIKNKYAVHGSDPMWHRRRWIV